MNKYGRWWWGWSIGLVLWGGGAVARALPPESAPEAVKTFVQRLDEAINQRNADSVLNLYSNNFTHGDGYDREALAKSLTRLWQRFPNLTYRTELTDWQPQGQGFVVELRTNIEGTEMQKNRQFNLTSTLKTRQILVQGQIQRQDILSEQTQLTSGKEPPQVTVNAPDVVAPGQRFDFDVIVQEPLRDDQVLGTAVTTPVTPSQLLENPRLSLEVLSAGGLFKTGQAPDQPGSQWLSAILVRQGGITVVTRRLRVGTP
ncbi:MAG: nuclear transport factor 2 family protein [Gloeomargarita sp. HHBFW_bins_162]